jgi:putative FmdB family regulatory protein
MTLLKKCDNMAIVTKTYDCPKCGAIEIMQSHKEQSKKCPTCKSKIERTLSAPMVAKDSAPKTVGTLIEQNNRRNKHGREKAMGDITERKLERESHFRKLANATPAQKRRYIEKGIL